MKVVKISAPNLEAEVVCKAFTSVPNLAAGTHIIMFSGVVKASLWDGSGAEDESTSLTMIEVADLKTMICHDVVD